MAVTKILCSRRSAVALLSLMAISGTSFAGPADFAPSRKFISGKLEELRKALSKPKSPARDAELTAIFDTMLDYDFFTKKTLGDHYQKLSPDQVERFSRTMRKLFQQAYTEKLQDPGRYKIEYTGEAEGADGTIVQTLMRDLKRGDKPLPMAYVVAKVKNQWLARDVVTDSVSLANNYRKQFGRILKKENGFDTLIGKMEKKLAKG